MIQIAKEEHQDIIKNKKWKLHHSNTKKFAPYLLKKYRFLVGLKTGDSLFIQKKKYIVEFISFTNDFIEFQIWLVGKKGNPEDTYGYELQKMYPSKDTFVFTKVGHGKIIESITVKKSEIRKTMPKEKLPYKFSDFVVIRGQERIYPNIGKLIEATVTNKVTGVSFTDWVRPSQLCSTKSLCGLIKWVGIDPTKGG